MNALYGGDVALWGWLLAACAACFAIKLAGFAVPVRWLQNPRMTQMAACMTVALLASLTVMNTVASGSMLVLDARLAALAVAAVALWWRAPFLLVVVLGAVAAALVRWLG